MTTMKTQVITLSIPYDADKYDQPSTWNWTELADSLYPVALQDSSDPVVVTPANPAG